MGSAKLNINYLILAPIEDMDKKAWYAHKDSSRLIPELKLGFLSMCLAERLKEPYFDIKKHGAFDPHMKLIKQEPPEYLKATIWTNMPVKVIEDALPFCKGYYEVRELDVHPTLHQIFQVKMDWIFGLAETRTRVVFADLDVVVRKSFTNLVEPNRIYFYSNEGFNIVKYCKPSVRLLDICKQYDLSLEINMWNTGFLSVPSVAFQNRKLAKDVHLAFVESGQISPIAEQSTLDLLLINYAIKNGIEVKETLDYFDHYWYYGKHKYRDFIL